MGAATQRSRQLLKAFVPAQVLQSRLHKRVYMQFAEKVGFVYFGYVDQRNDEHRLVRGLTVSSAHRDNHYCIGSFKGYDIAFVERTDTLHFPGKESKHHDWLIMTFDLHTPFDVPHIFVGLQTHSEVFYAHLFTKFSQLARAPLGVTGVYDTHFMSQYALYVEPSRAIEAEHLFNRDITHVIAERFGGMTLEIVDGTLYLYAEHQRPTMAFLEKMMSYGIWLAQAIDERSVTLHTLPKEG